MILDHPDKPGDDSLLVRLPGIKHRKWRVARLAVISARRALSFALAPLSYFAGGPVRCSVYRRFGKPI